MKSAQEAYQAALKNIIVDTTPVMEAAEKAVEDAISIGALTAYIGPFQPQMAEKGAIELESKYNYHALVQFSGKYTEGGTPLCNILLNFKYLPPPSREAYN